MFTSKLIIHFKEIYSMKMTLSVKNQSIETSGLPKDFREALCEYIWNGFEANATEVSLSYVENITGQGLDSISITDNGDGINYSSLSDTFGSFLVSQKNTLSLKAKTKAKICSPFTFAYCFFLRLFSA